MTSCCTKVADDGPRHFTQLVRLIAAQNAESTPRPDVAACWISPGWHEGLTFAPHPDWPVDPNLTDGAGGLATVMVVRPEQRSGRRVCVYLVGTFFLGVKNVTNPEAVSNTRLTKLRNGVFAGYDELAMSAPLELAQHVVLGAVEHARGLGLPPHPDFAAAADRLGAWSGPCPIEFGRNGSPLHIQVGSVRRRRRHRECAGRIPDGVDAARKPCVREKCRRRTR